MAHIKLRDRDAIITPEGLIFRVLGYTHPVDGYICDIEYAPSEIYQSSNPRALRSDGTKIFYKFYGDDGWRFLAEKCPQYLMDYGPLGKKVIGVRYEAIREVRRPEERLRELIEMKATDDLIRSLKEVLSIITEGQTLPLENFGVFGSILHGFYNPRFSDLDMVIYGRECLEKLRCILSDLYSRPGSQLMNEFADESSIKGKTWRFKNITPREFLWHQRRKLVYAVFHDKVSGRRIKTEFEPVKSWHEILGERQQPVIGIRQLGWIKAILRITDDRDSPFMPSIYHVEPIKIIEGPGCDDISRVISYVEEFRMQCRRDETAYVEGNLEEVKTEAGSFYQIALTYGPRYYEQTFKVIKATGD